MKGTRGGRKAAIPGSRWQPPQRLTGDGEGMGVRFVEETGGACKVFDFAGLPVQAGVARWLAGAFARWAGPRSGLKRLSSARGVFGTCRRFAAVLGQADPPVRGPQELAGAHVAAFLLRHAGTTTGRNDVITLRALLRDDPQLPEPARAALLAGRLPRLPEDGERDTVVAYTDREWQLVMTALRREVRTARDRITAGRDLLARYRAGQLAPGSPQARLGALLDGFDRTGDVPRQRSGNPAGPVSKAGGVDAVAGALCLTIGEMAAFCLLLAALTGENYGTIATWPAACHRPGGAAEPSGDDAAEVVMLVEQVKPRRGPEREHAVRALEDLPAGLAALLGADETDDRLFRSPARLYRLLVDLTRCARRHGGGASAFAAYAAAGGGFINGVTNNHSQKWARSRGFPAATSTTAGGGGVPPVDARRIRQTAIERIRRPVSHARATMNDHYLARSATVREESRTVVADALREEVAKARSAQAVPVLTAGTLARLQAHPDRVAAEAGIDPQALERMVAGEADTGVTACADHLSGPHTEPGQPCTASFLSCLDCPNARALPNHLPAQLAMAEGIAALRPHLDPALWRARYEPRLGQLQQILACYTTAEHHQARAEITEAHRALVGDILAGRWDLR